MSVTPPPPRKLRPKPAETPLHATRMLTPLATPGEINNPPRQALGGLGPYLRAIRAHRLLVAATTLIALVAAIAWTSVRSTTYEASATLLVTPLPQEDETFLGLEMIRDSGDPTRTVQTAATLVESNPAAARVAAKLGRDWDAERVLGAVSVNPVGESNVLAITASADSAGEATRIADLFARAALRSRAAILSDQASREIARLRVQLAEAPKNSSSEERISEQIGQLETVETHGDPTLTLSEKATPPTSPTGTSAAVIVVLALLGGFALGSGAAVLLEMTRRQVRDEEEAMALYPIPVLVRAPLLKAREQRRSRRETSWYMPPAVWEAFKTLLIQLHGMPKKGDGARVCLIVSASAGDGKTTTAVNLAAAAASGGESVAILDLDLRKPEIASSLRADATHAVADLLEPDCKLADLIEPAAAVPNLSLLGLSLGDSVGIVPAHTLAETLPRLIEEARQQFDLVVIDTAPLGQISDALHLLDAVDEVLIVVRPEQTLRSEFETTRDLIERTGHQAAGLVVIAESTHSRSSYYSYGSAERTLFASPGGGRKES